MYARRGLLQVTVVAGIDVGNATTEVVIGRVSPGRRRASRRRTHTDPSREGLAREPAGGRRTGPPARARARRPRGARVRRAAATGADGHRLAVRGAARDRPAVGRRARLDAPRAARASGSAGRCRLGAPRRRGRAGRGRRTRRGGVRRPSSAALAPLAAAGRLAAVLVEDDEGVLVANRLPARRARGGRVRRRPGARGRAGGGRGDRRRAADADAQRPAQAGARAARCRSRRSPTRRGWPRGCSTPATPSSRWAERPARDRPRGRRRSSWPARGRLPFLAGHPRCGRAWSGRRPATRFPRTGRWPRSTTSGRWTSARSRSRCTPVAGPSAPGPWRWRRCTRRCPRPTRRPCSPSCWASRRTPSRSEAEAARAGALTTPGAGTRGGGRRPRRRDDRRGVARRRGRRRRSR